MLVLDDLSQVHRFPAVGVLDRLETAVIQFNADGIRFFGLDGLADEVLGGLGNVGCADKDDFPGGALGVFLVYTVDVCAFCHGECQCSKEMRKNFFEICKYFVKVCIFRRDF